MPMEDLAQRRPYNAASDFADADAVPKPGSLADERLIGSLKAQVKASADLWKYPRWVEFRSDLPKTATGKIQRFKLREESAASGASGKAA